MRIPLRTELTLKEQESSRRLMRQSDLREIVDGKQGFSMFL
jgi:hypothetical protein